MKERLIALIVLDGWGSREETEGNAVALAKTPFFDRLWAEFPHTLIHASEERVGLPAGQMGNSEVGHLNLGAGRGVYQEIVRISKAIRGGGVRPPDLRRARHSSDQRSSPPAQPPGEDGADRGGEGGHGVGPVLRDGPGQPLGPRRTRPP